MTKRILIIDDDRDMLEMLQIVFQGSDFDIVLSNTGMRGNEIQVISPDLILLDVQIKGFEKSGDEICKEIKSDEKLNHIPVFLISSEHNLTSIAIECAADGYFAKPFDILNLKTVVQERLV